MSQFPKEQLEKVKEDFNRTRDRLTKISQSSVEYIQNGLRNTSDKQYNLNLSLLSIAVVMIGVVMPIALQSALQINHILIRLSTYSFIVSFLLGLAVSIYAPIKDRTDLIKILGIQKLYIGKLLDMVKVVLVKATNESLTVEDVNSYNTESVNENKTFAEKVKPPSVKCLNFLYYSFLVLFLLGLLFFILSMKVYLF